MSTKVSESTGYVPNVQMSAFGYAIAAILVVIMLPALPIIALAWIVWRVFVAEDQDESSYESWRNEADNEWGRSAAGLDDEAETEENAEDEAEATA
ncbi:DUF7535 family protein [Halobiforma nitratireducens]|uniref:Uncharacterized protein n=1 Tax=Halobiforma nitratireducens JCM 10879 TaxID=1227454 RepID=M0LAL1_9EURY|nr:hypothetical protein [Halobiforma nitratireducens]EMA30158.1 hypothetical protein C446_16792 [Halobiforma nitratireducens JCM 10879]